MIKKKIIAIDGTAYVEGRAPGFNNFLLTLLEGASKNWTLNYEILLFVREDQLSSFLLFENVFNVKAVKFNGVIARFFWQNFILPFLSPEYDLILFPANFAPFLSVKEYVLVIHDLNYLSFPGNYSFLSYFGKKALTKKSIVGAKRCVVISNQVKIEVFTYCGVTPTVIHNMVRAPKLNFDRTLLPSELEHAPSIIIVPSSLAVHKNVYSAYDAALGIVKADSNITFVFFGGWSVSEFRIKEPHSRILVLGYVSQNIKDALFSICRSVLVPSVYEGFGIPYIEALLIKRTLICCDIPIAREVAGSSPIYINAPYGAPEIADAIERARINNFHAENACDLNLNMYSQSHVSEKYIGVFDSILG